MYIKTRQKLRR